MSALPPESGHSEGGREMSAFDPKRHRRRKRLQPTQFQRHADSYAQSTA